MLSTAIISYFFTPFAGLLWIGRGRLAVGFLSAFIAIPLGAYVAVFSGAISLDSDLVRNCEAHLDWLFLAIGIFAAVGVMAISLGPQTPRWYSSGWMVVPAVLIFFAAFVLVGLSARALIYQPFSTPSGSMTPNIVAGDYVAASKWPYGYGRYSMAPLTLPIVGRVFERQPRRGDLIVFKYPKDTSLDYVKRVIGLPGERIQMVAGVVHVDGVPVDRERVGELTDEALSGNKRPVMVYRERLPNGVSYQTLDEREDGILDDTRAFTVDAGSYFVLGDNRDNSADSRVWGTVPAENLIGRVERIYWNSFGLPFAERSDDLMKAD
ncbi:signal peptidase I [Mesorhizobium australicum]|uniref:signal peptidase I n=1 Tax=Mesorhizobium australicum TaxID=536018 RepID=UPI001594E39B|nr:signal peptidase I [Mesorhizobium australicum]